MPDEIDPQENRNGKPQSYRFHLLVRISMLFLSGITAAYSVYFITYLIPKVGDVSIFIKIITVVILYISLSTLYKHLTGLNKVIISEAALEFRFLLRKRIIIPWQDLERMEIFKVVTHHWKIIYRDALGKSREFKTQLAFPGIMTILLSIQDHKPSIDLNELLKQVLIFKRSKS